MEPHPHKSESALSDDERADSGLEPGDQGGGGDGTDAGAGAVQGGVGDHGVQAGAVQEQQQQHAGGPDHEGVPEDGLVSFTKNKNRIFCKKARKTRNVTRDNLSQLGIRNFFTFKNVSGGGLAESTQRKKNNTNPKDQAGAVESTEKVNGL